jgi:hypothetical protein
MTICHIDMLGNKLKDEDTVVYSHHNNLILGVIKRSTPRMLILQAVGKRSSTDRKYPSEVLLIDDPKITIYMIKNSK